MTSREQYVALYGDEGYDLLCDYVEGDELFNPSDWPTEDYDWDMFVELVPQGMPTKKYLSPEEIAAILTMAQHDEYRFDMSSRFGVSPDGRVFEELSPDYKILGWTPEMQRWIDENME